MAYASKYELAYGADSTAKEVMLLPNIKTARKKPKRRFFMRYHSSTRIEPSISSNSSIVTFPPVLYIVSFILQVALSVSIFVERTNSIPFALYTSCSSVWSSSKVNASSKPRVTRIKSILSLLVYLPLITTVSFDEKTVTLSIEYRLGIQLGIAGFSTS